MRMGKKDGEIRMKKRGEEEDGRKRRWGDEDGE